MNLSYGDFVPSAIPEMRVLASLLQTLVGGSTNVTRVRDSGCRKVTTTALAPVGLHDAFG
jgi:hypothetical protein